MKKMIPAMVFVAALWVWMLMGIPHYSDIMLIGSIMFVILLPWVFWLLWRKGKRQNRIEPVSAEIFEDPRRRKITAAACAVPCATVQRSLANTWRCANSNNLKKGRRKAAVFMYRVRKKRPQRGTADD